MRPLHILAVDDDALIGIIINTFTRKLGHTCQLSTSGEEALELYAKHDFDLVLIDRIMPGMDGLRTTQRVRQLQEHRGWRPIIMLSSASDVDEQVLALNSGCDDFLAKPINFSILEAKINSFWRIADMQQQIARNHEELVRYANLEAEEKRISSFLMERLVRRDMLENPNIEHYLQPARVVSGDLLLVSASRTNDLYVMLADATGHGLPAALSLIPLSQTFYAMTAKGFQLSSIMHELNQQHRAHSPSDRFVAAIAACYRPMDNTLEVWNGGIPPAFLLNDDGEILCRFRSANLPLGIVDNTLFDSSVEVFKLPDEHTQLFMYSDGLIEAEDATGTAFGKARLELLLQQPASRRLAHLQACLSAHLGTQSAHDDVSYLQLLCKEPSSSQLGQNPTLQKGSGNTDNWSLHLQLSAPQLKHLDLEPLITHFCQTLGLEESRQGVFGLILRELLSNALDHGLLGLTSSLKHEANGFERYVQLRNERLMALDDGEIQLEINQSSDAYTNHLSIKVSDSGPGFDVAKLEQTGLHNDPERYHGRGLLLLRKICSHLEFRGNGNHVIAELHWPNEDVAGATHRT
ncbi:fused response regulator/phosphatase [Pseudomonas sp. SL4(2022)]|uniref:fused response regulator/phosphatase n=1 Tax=Pseudomonas sp. SL4(2022) TaxID=2994661 RepID=UPI00226D484C|nr:fused response regulator/phosphatase [Pseudomonas sp. SL4(2022)]WAC46560.1 fused response regulator/phosphatase [Pseudomonas sp. SL4(2022)]